MKSLRVVGNVEDNASETSWLRVASSVDMCKVNILNGILFVLQESKSGKVHGSSPVRNAVAEVKTDTGLLEVEEAVCRYMEAASRPSEVLNASRLNKSVFRVHKG
jgi:hypothetical protein